MSHEGFLEMGKRNFDQNCQQEAQQNTEDSMSSEYWKKSPEVEIDVGLLGNRILHEKGQVDEVGAE